MTAIAGLRGWNMAAGFAGGGCPVVASRASAWCDTGMRERRGLPRGSAVTAITGCGCGKVVDGFALSAGGVMARRTSTGLQAAVGKRRRCPCLVLMTRIALLQGRNMVAVLGRT